MLTLKLQDHMSRKITVLILIIKTLLMHLVTYLTMYPGYPSLNYTNDSNFQCPSLTIITLLHKIHEALP